jgi:hypothetical protein
MLATSLGALPLGGKVDRIDRRDGKRIILDYKTGSVGTFSAGHFEKALAELAPPKAFDYEGLQQVREAITDLQLPLYVLLVSSAAAQDLAAKGTGAATGGTIGGVSAGATGVTTGVADVLSAYVELRSPGRDQFKERYFVRPDRLAAVRDAYEAWFAETFPELVAYVIDHMAKAPQFYRATDEADCSHCDYQAICGLTF